MKEIETLTIIVGTKDLRKKIVFKFNKDKPTYEVIKDYILIEKNDLSNNLIKDILNGISKSKMNVRSKDYGYHNEFSKYFWILKFEYTTKDNYYKSGSDILPSDWNIFIKPFKQLLPKEVGALC